MSVSQSARSVLMVSPASFDYDEQTAPSNSFQVRPDLSRPDTISHAMAEFRAAVEKLEQANVEVIVHQGNPDDKRPNAVFPNNWISTWPDGQVFLYPMATESRRPERDERVLNQLAENYSVNQITDLSGSETEGKYLESTGAIIFDHVERVAYGCLSPRCDREIFEKHVTELGYQPIAFEAFDQTGVPIYHTNVMMGIQSTTAVICSQAIADPKQRKYVLDNLGKNHHIIDISFEQMGAFCGNVLEVENRYGKKLLVLSQSAFDAFSDTQKAELSADKALVPLEIPIIEEAGGGSARCMLAEIFLPAKLAATQPVEQTSLQSRA